MGFKPAQALARLFPVFDWGRGYGRATLSNDLLAALIVTLMLVPQSLAYAMLAGLPPEAGLYASIVPILGYALFGSSRVLAVGPVAVVSLMTAASVGAVAAEGTAGYAVAALTLAALSGAMLLAMGLFRLGFLANFLSHPVISGFITASGILIATSQLRHILGVSAQGDTWPQMLASLARALPDTNWITLVIGASTAAFLYWVRKGAKPVLIRAGVRQRPAAMLAKTGPVLAVLGSTLAVWGLGLTQHGVRVVGAVPQGLPGFSLPSFAPDLLGALLLPAALISIVGFVESVSVAQTLAAKRRQRIDPDQELIGLGAANLGAAFSGGFPVTGGFARSVVNFDAGAETPAAGAFTALGLALVALALTPLLYYLPTAALAATIIVAVLSLVDGSILARSWAYSKADFAAVAATILVTLILGVEPGISVGVALSLGLHLYRTSRPHVAEVGLVPGTQHFRNIHRHRVATDPALLSLRIDESLYFANARFLEAYLTDRLTQSPEVRDVVLMCSAINEIDLSALETLEAINARLADAGVRLHLSEVKGPVMDRLEKTHFIKALSGNVYLAQWDAWQALATAPSRAAPAA